MTGEQAAAITDQLEPHEAAELRLRPERGYQRALEEAVAAVGTPEQRQRRELADELGASASTNPAPRSCRARGIPLSR
jgi:hypothetical protein